VSVRAAGLQRRFQDSNTIMCLIMAQYVIEPLEGLNRALQSVKMTVAGMLELAKTVSPNYKVCDKTVNMTPSSRKHNGR
jgi:hypothetical protein